MANRRAPTKRVDVFESTLQKTNIWLKDLESLLRTEDRPRAYTALRAVLHALRDCLPLEAAAKLSAQMPLLVRGVFLEGWKPRRKPTRMSRTRFLGAIRDALRGQDAVDPALAARGVFQVLARHMSEGELAHARRVLPGEVREFWAACEGEAAASRADDAEETSPSPSRIPEWQPGWAARQTGERAGGVTDLPYWDR